MQAEHFVAGVPAERDEFDLRHEPHFARQTEDRLHDLRLALRRRVFLDFEDQFGRRVFLSLCEELPEGGDFEAARQLHCADFGEAVLLRMKFRVENLRPVIDDQRVVGRHVDVELHAVDSQLLGVAQARYGIFPRSFCGMESAVCDHLGLGGEHQRARGESDCQK